MASLATGLLVLLLACRILLVRHPAATLDSVLAEAREHYAAVFNRTDTMRALDKELREINSELLKLSVASSVAGHFLEFYLPLRLRSWSYWHTFWDTFWDTGRISVQRTFSDARSEVQLLESALYSDKWAALEHRHGRRIKALRDVDAKHGCYARSAEGGNHDSHSRGSNSNGRPFLTYAPRLRLLLDPGKDCSLDSEWLLLLEMHDLLGYAIQGAVHAYRTAAAIEKIGEVLRERFAELHGKLVSELHMPSAQLDALLDTWDELLRGEAIHLPDRQPASSIQQDQPRRGVHLDITRCIPLKPEWYNQGRMTRPWPVWNSTWDTTARISPFVNKTGPPPVPPFLRDRALAPPPRILTHPPLKVCPGAGAMLPSHLAHYLVLAHGQDPTPALDDLSDLLLIAAQLRAIPMRLNVLAAEVEEISQRLRCGNTLLGIAIRGWYRRFGLPLESWVQFGVDEWPDHFIFYEFIEPDHVYIEPDHLAPPPGWDGLFSWEGQEDLGSLICGTELVRSGKEPPWLQDWEVSRNWF